MSQLTPTTEAEPSAKPSLRVAVGVMGDDRQRVLIALRPEGKHQGGLWEFPGGKVEAGETVRQALARELAEELGIELLDSEPLIVLPYDYPDKRVILEVHRVTRFRGQPRGAEGQHVRWVPWTQLGDYTFPAANHTIMKALKLPPVMAVTGQYRDLGDFETRFRRVVDAGAGMVYLRAPEVDTASHSLFRAASRMAEVCGVDLLVNPEVAGWEAGAAGCHLRAAQLYQYSSRPVDSQYWVGASCHNQAEIERAQTLDLDYIVLSPVQRTASHPEATPLGFDAFSRLAERSLLPVYGLGGLHPGDLERLRTCGAQGLAAISALWGGASD